MSSHLMWQERLTCWNMEHYFRQNCKWQASLYPFHERFLLDLETRTLAILHLHSDEDGREWGRKELRLTTSYSQMNRLERCGYDGKKIAGSPLLPGAFGQHTHTPSLLPPTHGHPWPKEDTRCAFQGPDWMALCEARRARYVLYCQHWWHLNL